MRDIVCLLADHRKNYFELHPTRDDAIAAVIRIAASQGFDYKWDNRRFVDDGSDNEYFADSDGRVIFGVYPLSLPTAD